ncbi:unnamed protein product [Pedinophyceae sp. YPF-701]|nr:unnamed protein product [Pedinophyceae sp. YPF-701]
MMLASRAAVPVAASAPREACSAPHHSALRASSSGFRDRRARVATPRAPVAQPTRRPCRAQGAASATAAVAQLPHGIAGFLLADPIGQGVLSLAGLVAAMAAVGAADAVAAPKTARSASKEAPKSPAALLKGILARASRVSTVVNAVAAPLRIHLLVLALVKAVEVATGGLERAVSGASAVGLTIPPPTDPTLQLILSSISTSFAKACASLATLSKVSGITMTAWAMLRWRDAALVVVDKALQASAESDSDEGTPEAETAELALGIVNAAGLLGWVVCGWALLGVLAAVGIDIRPFLALTGVSGLVAGFAAQSFIGNILAGATIFLSRPFAVGERIELRTSTGSTLVLSGVVTRVQPTRVTVRNDEGLRVTVPNKSVLDCMVVHKGAGGRVQKA